MFVRSRETARCEEIVDAVNAWLASSRFRAGRVHALEHERWRRVVEIRDVRLRQKKRYCGQHPNECLNKLRKEPMGSWLEGADWIGFNDGLNDLFDRMHLEADVWSFNRDAGYLSPTGFFRAYNQYFIRKGRCRRVTYDSAFWELPKLNVGGFWFWLRDGVFADWIGKTAPRSTYPEGTPGLADWRIPSEAGPV